MAEEVQVQVVIPMKEWEILQEELRIFREGAAVIDRRERRFDCLTHVEIPKILTRSAEDAQKYLQEEFEKLQKNFESLDKQISDINREARYKSMIEASSPCLQTPVKKKWYQIFK